MSLTSFLFLIALSLSVIIYYIVPHKCRWMLLLLYSVAFYAMSSTWYTAVYLVLAILNTHFCGIGTGNLKKIGKERKACILTSIGIIVDIVMLAVLKYSNFVIVNMSFILQYCGKNELDLIKFVTPIGISYYTLTAVGYLLDCYWEKVVPQKNILKTALFIGYYPQLTSGPITRYGEMEGLYEGHVFKYENVTFGVQRILWGMFKKLVIASRTGIIVDAIYADTVTYEGFYIWLAASLFVVQLYADFSGCIDIIMGASECYGIELPENFQNPFWSESVQEFWQRWHITLGGWMKDYILYPVLRTKMLSSLGRMLKKRGYKKAAKRMPTYIGMLIVWILIGIWHGGAWKYILGMGIWFWTCIVVGQYMEPLIKKCTDYFKINVEAFSWHLLRSIIVFILVTVGNMFFRLGGFSETLHVIHRGFAVVNPWIFFDHSILNLGVTQIDIYMIILGIVLMIIADALREKYEHARNWIRSQNLWFRWSVWLGLFVILLIYGMYGPGYDAADFIYRGF